MKKRINILLWALLAILLPTHSAAAVEITDALDRTLTIENPLRVAALYGSYADVWLNAGGTLVGTVSDALGDERLGDDTVNLGSIHSPNMELLFALDPDLVLLSADISQHAEVGELLEQANIPHLFLSTSKWQDYMDMLRLFTEITGRNDLLEEQIKTVQEPIEATIAEAQQGKHFSNTSCLLLRANSSSVKAKGSDDTIAGGILKDMGLVNIADGESPLRENLSLEAILAADPDCIFIVYQGSDPDAAAKAVAGTLTSSPAWNTLTAVREGRVHVLERELFHYHPNSRWAEAYAVIAKALQD